MTVRYEQYEHHRPCRKCGDREAITTYLHGNDTMRRKCRRCDYAWTELPLDRGTA